MSETKRPRGRPKTSDKVNVSNITERKPVTNTLNRKELLEKRRKERTDLGTMRNKFKKPTGKRAEGMKFYLTNDDSTETVQHMLSLGWRIWDEQNEQPDDPNQVTEMNVTTVGSITTIPIGGGHRGVLFYMPNDIWEIDQELKDEPRRDREELYGKAHLQPNMYGEGIKQEE